MASSAELLSQVTVPTFTVGGTVSPVRVRKSAVFLDGEPTPLVVVTVARDGERERLYARKDLVRYVVTATLITESNAKAANDPAIQQWQADAEAKLNAPSSYPGTVNEVRPSAKPPFDANGQKAQKNYTTVAVLVEVIEDRTY